MFTHVAGIGHIEDAVVIRYQDEDVLAGIHRLGFDPFSQCAEVLPPYINLSLRLTHMWGLKLCRRKSSVSRKAASFEIHLGQCNAQLLSL